MTDQIKVAQQKSGFFFRDASGIFFGDTIENPKAAVAAEKAKKIYLAHNKESAEKLASKSKGKVPVAYVAFQEDLEKAKDFLEQNYKAKVILEGAESKEAEKTSKQSPATAMIWMGKNNCQFFYDENREAYAAILGEVKQIYAVKSTTFKNWLKSQYYKETGKGASNSAANDALDTLEAVALNEGQKIPVYRRFARVESKIYLDLCNDSWQVVEVTASGWKVLDKSPVYFTRSQTMKPLPAPVAGGKIEKLREFINVNDNDFVLVVAWLLQAINGVGGLPILCLQGEQGSGKSTTSENLRRLIDDCKILLAGKPRDEESFAVTALNNQVLALDNLSGIDAEMSDLLCRISTGYGLTGRKRYTDFEEASAFIKRPILLNGIDEIATRPDLLSRSLIVVPPQLPDDERGSVADMAFAFEKARPAILGALLTALSAGLKNEKDVEVAMPRLADFARWVTACETGFGWKQGTFMSIYNKNRNEANVSTVEESLLGNALLKLLDAKGGFIKMAPTSLYESLSDLLSDDEKRNHFSSWPRSTKGLKNQITRLKPALRTMGIVVEETRTSDSRFYVIRKESPSQPQASNLSSVNENANLHQNSAVCDEVGFNKTTHDNDYEYI
jgi:hypothetical protein